MNIQALEYDSKFCLADPIHAARHFRKVKNGNNIPKNNRIIVKESPTDVVVRLIPFEYQLYKDGNDYFFNKEELKDWDEYDSLKDYLEKYSINTKIYLIKKRNIRK